MSSSPLSEAEAELQLLALSQQFAERILNRRLEYLERMYRRKAGVCPVVRPPEPVSETVPQPSPSDGGSGLG